MKGYSSVSSDFLQRWGHIQHVSYTASYPSDGILT